ncbi:MAG TPA: histidinol dehydrogenase [Candidatus Tumulicola sp.]|nr:histidinol dehydrogenase [Candidatus Tumulicola sp.]
MNVVTTHDPAVLARLRRRGWEAPQAVIAEVAAILTAVRQRGDAALSEYARRFDDPGFDLAGLRVAIPALETARAAVTAELAAAFETAKERISNFHERQRQADLNYAAEDGSRYGLYRRPLSSVAAYVPGGAATLASSVLMGAVPARIAGVGRVVVLTPPRRGGLHPALLFACALCGVDELYAAGGAQAVAAAAFGTASIAPVDKIVGPGGTWTTEAKRQVFGTCGVDTLAGPSEVLVVADDGANSEYVAGELLAQAEHAGAARLAVVSESRPLLEAVAQLLDSLDVKTLERGQLISDAIDRDCLLVHAQTRDEIFEVVDAFAPAALSLQVRDARPYLPRIARAGAVFVGDTTPLSSGDYLAGINHVLPTAGTARFASALCLSDFMRSLSVVEYSAERIAADAPAIADLAQLEGLPQHAHTARMRYGA